MKKYEEIEHTADLGLRIYGESLEALLANAGQGMFSLIGELRELKQTREIRLNVPFSDPSIPSSRGLDSLEAAEDLLPEWLRRLLTEFNLRAFFPFQYALTLNVNGLTAELTGALFEPGRDVFYTEIKGVTFHGLKVAKMEDRWQAEVIFDV
ncbi:MAG TPA: archease [Acidobacteriota bacterium]|jgi:SHS2 domain-containing protein